jgi:hypothetical protein
MLRPSREGNKAATLRNAHTKDSTSVQARKSIGLLAIVAIALAGVWLYTLAGSAGQLHSLLHLSAPASVAATTDAPTRAPVNIERSASHEVETPPPTTPAASVATETPTLPAEPFNEDHVFIEQRAGPIGGAEFAELLESGLLPESSDPAAAEELRNALREAAAIEEAE